MARVILANKYQTNNVNMSYFFPNKFKNIICAWLDHLMEQYFLGLKYVDSSTRLGFGFFRLTSLSVIQLVEKTGIKLENYADSISIIKELS